MGSSKITFPVVGKSVRRNAETGVEIVKSEPDNGDGVYYTVRLGDDAWSAPTLAEAREYAIECAEAIRRELLGAWSDAVTENAQRAIAKHCPEVVTPVISEDNARNQFPSVFAMVEAEAHEQEARSITASIPREGRPQAVTELLERAELLNDITENLSILRLAFALYEEIVAAHAEALQVNALRN